MPRTNPCLYLISSVGVTGRHWQDATVRGDDITARVSVNPMARLLPEIEISAEAAAVMEAAALELGPCYHRRLQV